VETRRKVELGPQTNSTPYFIELFWFCVRRLLGFERRFRNFPGQFHPRRVDTSALVHEWLLWFSVRLRARDGLGAERQGAAFHLDETVFLRK